MELKISQLSMSFCFFQWNDVIEAFRHGVPRGKHRRYMRTAENCFVGSAAVDWIFDYLKNAKKDASFGREVTRSVHISLPFHLYVVNVIVILLNHIVVLLLCSVTATASHES